MARAHTRSRNTRASRNTHTRQNSDYTDQLRPARQRTLSRSPPAREHGRQTWASDKKGASVVQGSKVRCSAAHSESGRWCSDSQSAECRPSLTRCSSAPEKYQTRWFSTGTAALCFTAEPFSLWRQSRQSSQSTLEKFTQLHDETARYASTPGAHSQPRG